MCAAPRGGTPFDDDPRIGGCEAPGVAELGVLSDPMANRTAAPQTMMALRGIGKAYGSVVAVRHVDLDLRGGEVHALLGDNGAGKSTVLKIAAGALLPDHGEIVLGDQVTPYRTPYEARRLGIETVYQDLALAVDRSSVANVFAGRELLRRAPLRWFGVLDRPRMLKHTADAFGELDVPISRPGDPVGTLSGGQRQAVAIARAAMWASRVVLLDEPTAALSVTQREKVLTTVARLRDRGLAVLIITHNISEILEVADRVTVLRMGEVAATGPAAAVDIEWVVRAMIGERTRTRDLGAESPGDQRHE